MECHCATRNPTRKFQFGHYAGRAGESVSALGTRYLVRQENQVIAEIIACGAFRLLHSEAPLPTGTTYLE